MSEWKEYALEDVCSRLSSGKNIPASEVSEQGKFPVYGGNGLRGFASKSNFEGDCAIIGRQGAFCGNVRFFSGKGYMTEHAVVVCGNDKSDTRYLSYLLSTMQLGRLSGQSAQPGLAVGTLAKQIISLPPLEEQKRIAGILSSLDDKIELNNKINDNLEKQAQALFKNWFIDFAPFGGEMPEDWRMYQLSELTDFVPGYSYKGSELVESNIGMATIKNFERNGGFKLDGFKDIQPSDKIKNTQYVDVFDILVSHTDLTQNAEVIGNVELILSKGKYQKLIMSMDLVKVVAKNGVSPFLIASILRTDRFKKHCLGYVNGTTVLHMSKKALPEYEIALPRDLSVLDSFAKMSESMIRQMSICIEENQRLTTLRDTLLPKLMSGEMNVENIQI